MLRRNPDQTITASLPGDAGANVVYMLGGAAEHYDLWGIYTQQKRAQLVEEMQARAAEKSREGSALGTAVIGQRCDSWNQAVYDRLILEGHKNFEVIPWAAATKKAMMSVGPTKKVAALLAHGLLPRVDWCDAITNFKDSRFYPVKPIRSKDKAANRDWEAAVETAKLRHVCDFPFPNQCKENVHSVRRRLASCLYYDILCRDTEGLGCR